MNGEMDWGVTFFRLAASIVLGGAIGIEREIHGKEAGLRTHMLVALGSSLFTVLSYSLVLLFGSEARSDMTRIAAQIIPGVGFLGAGTIMRARGTVHGLTTAASVWLVAAIGMAAGGGFYRGAILATLLGHLVLVGINHVEQTMIRRRAASYAVRARFAGEEDVLWVDQMLRDAGPVRVLRWQAMRVPDGLALRIDGRMTRKELDRLLDRLKQHGGLSDIRVRRM